MTVLVPELADEHERRGPTCLLAPDGETTCDMPATHRVELEPIDGHPDGPVTFACDEHVDVWRQHPHVATIREVRR